ncbi:hypothetical protein HZA85_04175 [Candidatus Uhrbacteria bacterium]|nr:hypothetical protein [Candidatus Uhrbacteria bacterium]
MNTGESREEPYGFPCVHIIVPTDCLPVIFTLSMLMKRDQGMSQIRLMNGDDVRAGSVRVRRPVGARLAISPSVLASCARMGAPWPPAH